MSGALHLCQASSNHGPGGRKNDFADGERMIKRLVAQELRLSFVPDPEHARLRANNWASLVFPLESADSHVTLPGILFGMLLAPPEGEAK